MTSTQIVEQVIRAVRRDERGVFLDGKSVEGLHHQLVAFKSGPQLFEAMQKATVFACFLGREKKAPEAAKQLLALIEGCLPRLVELAGADLAGREHADLLRQQIAQQKSALEGLSGAGAALPKKQAQGVRLRKR